MSLQSELDNLRTRIASFQEPRQINDEQWQDFADKAVVALMAGGESSRFTAVSGDKAIQKNIYSLPNGDTMMEMAIRLYRDAGIKKFVALVYHNAYSVQELLGDGSKYGVEIVYSEDPEQPVGKGGAVRNALDNGSIPEDSYLIVINPDDVIHGFPALPRYIAGAHLEGEAQGMVATPVLAPGQAFASTGMMVVENKIVDTQMYPMIPVPAHVGITVFSPAVLPRFRELFDLTKKSDFEQVLFPLLAAEEKLWSVGLHEGEWIAVNDAKSYKRLMEVLADEESN